MEIESAHEAKRRPDGEKEKRWPRSQSRGARDEEESEGRGDGPASYRSLGPRHTVAGSSRPLHSRPSVAAGSGLASGSGPCRKDTCALARFWALEFTIMPWISVLAN